uniref:Methyltransferase FkbM domain-containing protein n=1 Tax=Panagrolaimus davidi TaxID=227884 RepID=A0A914R4M5_9BILA
MDNFSNSVLGEKKMFLPMSSDYSQEKCRWVTIGIGGVTAAEELFKEKYPKCSVFGIEPADAGNFSRIGKLIPYGVGLEDAETKLTILDKGKYISKTMKVVEFTKLLDEFVGSRFIHYLTIDIEGFEYGILRELINNGQFAKAGITICQIDAELHNPKFSNAHESIKKLNPVQFILDFLDNPSPYIPIFNVPYLKHPHQKVTFVNIVDAECLEAFNTESYFDKK